MTVPVPDPKPWRRMAAVEQRINELEKQLARLLSLKSVTPLNGRLWRCTLTSEFGAVTADEASADLYTLSGDDTSRSITLSDLLGTCTAKDTDEIYCVEQIDLGGRRYYVPLRPNASDWHIGVVITSAIAATASGTVEETNCSWVVNGTTYTVYNPHDIELPVGWHVRWTKYPTCDDWVVEPWQFTECPPD